MCVESLIQYSLILHMHLHLYALVQISRKPPLSQQLWLSGTRSKAKAVLQLYNRNTVQPTTAKCLCAVSGRAGDRL